MILFHKLSTTLEFTIFLPTSCDSSPSGMKVYILARRSLISMSLVSMYKETAYTQDDKQ